MPNDWEDEEFAGDDTDAGDGSDEEQESELDADTAALVEREAQKRVAAHQAQMADALRKRGLAFTGGDVAIADPNAMGAWLGAPQTAQTPAAAQDPAADAVPEIDFAYATTEEIGRYMDALIAKRLEAATAPLKEEIQQHRQFQHQSQQERAMGRVRDAVESHAPHLKAFLEHPDFEQAMAQAIGQAQGMDFSDSRTLAKVAAFVTPDLDAAKLPRRSRDDQGRFAQGQSFLSQMGSSRDSGRGAPPPKHSDYDRDFAQLEGVSPAIAKALADPTGAEYERVLAEEQRRNRK